MGEKFNGEVVKFVILVVKVVEKFVILVVKVEEKDMILKKGVIIVKKYFNGLEVE